MTTSTNTESKRKLDESLALLNSLFAHPSKKHLSDTPAQTIPFPVTQPTEPTVIPPEASAILAKQHANLKKRVFLPPRPAILDKLSKLTGSRPTLQDSIAASLAASAPTPRAPALTKSASNITAEEAAATTAEETAQSPLGRRVDSAGLTKMRYLPWSREQFHERLETFKPSTWFDKPKLVNAVECAKWGWINKGDDRLECCGGCGGVVIVRIDQMEEKASSSTIDNSTLDAEGIHVADASTNDLGLDDALPDLDAESLGPKFHAMLTSNHVAGCPWTTHPCDDSIYKFPVLSYSHARKEFVDRAKRLEKVKDDPLTEFIRHPLTANEVGKLTGLYGNEAEAKLLILSLFGWNATETPKVLACEACHTRCTYIPSFGFRKTGVRDDDDDVFMEDDEEASFDTIQAHKWYCYWVDPEHNEMQEVGWRIFYKSLTSGSGGQVNQSQPQSDQQDASLSSAVSERMEPSEAVAMVKRILRGQVALF